MRQELHDILAVKYPKLFAKYLSVTIGDGWFWLIDALCYQLQQHTDLLYMDQVFIIVVKQKFAGLRVECRGEINPIATGMIVFAQTMSSHICEVCGQKGKVRLIKKIYVCRCDTHATGMQSKRVPMEILVDSPGKDGINGDLP